MVSVVLSSYNGASYLEAQLRSILEQSVEIDAVHIRDDGSTDGTRELLLKYSKLNPKIHVYFGENIGYRKSFAWLLHYASGLDKSDYIAIADQDDYWKPDKLQVAISELRNSVNSVLYGSGLTICDEELNVLREYDLSTYNPTLGSVLVRQRISGCTMVFTRRLLLQFRAICPFEKYPNGLSHDLAITMLAAVLDRGIVVGARNDLLLHRRHSKSVTSNNMGLLSRLRVEFNLIKTANSRAFWINRILKNGAYSPSSESLLYLANSNRMSDKLKLLFDKRLSSGIKVCDIEARIKILIGTF